MGPSSRREAGLSASAVRTSRSRVSSIRPSPSPDALQALRATGASMIMRSFPQGALVVFDHDLRYLCAGGLGLADVGLSQAMLEGYTIFEVFPPEVVAFMEPGF